ncbi:hypothetical protein, partial [uncultured Microscilla sp.]|uniref:hypothetical protein n=1 Tax=uncultured Microscilla sp. TaxID=432653 RepID=UPI002638F4C6
NRLWWVYHHLSYSIQSLLCFVSGHTQANSYDGFGILAKHSLMMLEQGLGQAVRQLGKLKIPESVWNNPNLKEPAKTILPLLVGIYNGLVEQAQEAPEDIKHLMLLAKAIVWYIRDETYRKDLNQKLEEIKKLGLEKIVKQII